MKEKRGSTLAELVIVMAVLSVMTIMVLSFTAICGAWSRLGIYRYNLTREERTISTGLHYFVQSFDEYDYFFYSDQSNIMLARNGDGKVYYFQYKSEEQRIYYNTLDGEASFEISNINDLSFYIRPAADGPGQLVYCYVTYTPPVLNNKQKPVQQTYTILVAARASNSRMKLEE